MQSRLEGIYEEARDVARALAKTEAFERILRLAWPPAIARTAIAS
jgi:hypothetical protein